jgi:hypothetical protein
MSVPVESPSCATAFPDLPSPVIAVGRNCEHKCNCRCHDDSAQDSNEKYTYRFVRPAHFLSVIESHLRSDSFIESVINPNRLSVRATIADFLGINHEFTGMNTNEERDDHGFEPPSLPSLGRRYPRGFAFYLAGPIGSIETRSLPRSLAATRRGFAFYLADPIGSIRGWRGRPEMTRLRGTAARQAKSE